MRQSIFTLILLFLTAAPARAGDATILGTGLGAAVGGLFGSQFGHGSTQLFATALGVAAGATIGNDVGRSVDYDDARASNRTPFVSSGSSYDSAPIAFNGYAPNYVAPPAPPPIYADPDNGTYCRTFSQRVRIGNQIQESYGTACLQPDGSWRIVP